MTRMELLDVLIRLGWGDVPFRAIEYACKRNGGVLPSVVPDGPWQQATVERERWENRPARASGEANHNAKLTEENVRWIRHNPESLSIRQMADRLEISPSVVFRIYYHQAWKQVA